MCWVRQLELCERATAFLEKPTASGAGKPTPSKKRKVRPSSAVLCLTSASADTCLYLRSRVWHDGQATKGKAGKADGEDDDDGNGDDEVAEATAGAADASDAEPEEVEEKPKKRQVGVALPSFCGCDDSVCAVRRPGDHAQLQS